MNTTSCSKATSAAAAIFHVRKYRASTRDTRTKNATSAWMALVVTVDPHDGPTKELLTCSASTPNASARSARTSSEGALSSWPVCTRTVSVPIKVTEVSEFGAACDTASWAVSS